MTKQKNEKPKLQKYKTETLTKVTPDTMAFIHQQCVDLHRFLLPDSLLAAEISRVWKSNRKRAKYRVRLSLSGAGAVLKVTGVGNDILTAVAAAKEKMLSRLLAIEEEVRGTSSWRDDLATQFVTIH